MRRKIESLEQNLEQYEKQKKALLHTVDQMKEEWTEKETSLQTRHNQQVSSLSKQLDLCQAEFEKKMTTFESLMAEFEQEKKDAMLELKKCHQLEINNLLKAQRNESTGLSDEMALLKQRHEEETAQLRAAYESLKTSAEVTEADYEGKLRKMKAFYDNEMEALNKSRSESFSEREAFLQDKLDRLTKDLQFQEVQSRKRIEGLLEEASQAEGTITDLQSQISCLRTGQSIHGQSMEELAKQVSKIIPVSPVRLGINSYYKLYTCLTSDIILFAWE